MHWEGWFEAERIWNDHMVVFKASDQKNLKILKNAENLVVNSVEIGVSNIGS